MRTWLRTLRNCFQDKKRALPVRSRRLVLETLEDRRLLSGDLIFGAFLLSDQVEAVGFSGVLASFHDTDTHAAAGDYSVTIEWGDGAVTPGSVSDLGGSSFNISGSHVYASDGRFPVQIRVDDVDGTSATGNSLVVVADAPITSTGILVQAVEGQQFTAPVASFSQSNPNATAGNFTATIDWGDGTAPSNGTIAVNGSGFTVNGSHAYASEGAFPVNVHISSKGGSTSSASSSATVTDALLTATGVPIQIVEGGRFNGVVATLTDANSLATPASYTATIDWGDGTPATAATIRVRQSGGFEVVGQHTFNDVGTFPVTITVLDPGGSGASASSTATVTDAPLLGVGVPVNVPRTGAANNVLVATFTDLGGAQPAGTYTATINWGDGTAASQGTITVDNGTFSVTGTHTFSGPGRFPLSITIHSPEGSSTVVATNAFVGSQSDRFVAQAYRDILGREADPNGLTHFTRLLDQSQATRTQVAQQLISSVEYRTKVVRELYRTLLRREADPTGLTVFVNFLGAGGTTSQLKSLLIGSAEYFVTQGGGTVNGFLTAVYRDVLGRGIDPNGQATFTFLLNNGASRTAVAQIIVGSRESSVRVVTGLYQTYLRRNPDDGGMTNFVSALLRGVSEEAIIANMVGSNEYFGKL